MKIRQGLIALAAISLSVGAVNMAAAQDWHVEGEFGWFAVGTVHQLEEGHIYWLGEFTGTFFNDEGEGSLFHRAGVKCPAFDDYDFNAGVETAGGYCVITDIDGDQAYLSWSGGGDTVTANGTFEYTGGTGKYEGISGSNTFSSSNTINWADGTSTGYATWNR